MTLRFTPKTGGAKTNRYASLQSRRRASNPKPPAEPNKPRDPKHKQQVFQGGVPVENDWHTMPVSERHPELPGISDVVRLVAQAQIDPAVPKVQSTVFKNVSIVAGTRRLTFRDFNQTHFKFGRAANNHLVLSGARDRDQTSRRHASIYLENGWVFFEDTSMNGSEIDGKRLLYAHHHFRVTPPTPVRINPDLRLNVGFDLAGNLEITVLNPEALRFALKRNRENKEGYYFTTMAPRDQRDGESVTVTRIHWENLRREDQFREAKKVDSPEIIDEI